MNLGRYPGRSYDQLEYVADAYRRRVRHARSRVRGRRRGVSTIVDLNNRGVHWNVPGYILLPRFLLRILNLDR